MGIIISNVRKIVAMKKRLIFRHLAVETEIRGSKSYSDKYFSVHACRLLLRSVHFHPLSVRIGQLSWPSCENASPVARESGAVASGDSAVLRFRLPAVARSIDHRFFLTFLW
jgi:hypothetical protein